MILRLVATVAFVCLALSNSGAYRATEACPCSLFDASAVPAVEDTGADAPVTLGVKFVAEHDGQISAIRFYKSAANVGPHVGHVWSSSGALLGSVTFDNETASGWQEATFDSPIAVSGGQTYTASYRAPTGHYSFTGEFFLSPFTNGPLTAPDAIAASGNGVFTYGVTMPTTSYRAANYFVDVVYAPAAIPFTVNWVMPSAGATNASPPIAATFSRPVEPGSIVFELRKPDGGLVPSTVSYDVSSGTAALTLGAPLLGATTYTASVSARAVTGEPLTPPYSWSFTTGAVGFRDTVVLSGLTLPTTVRFAPGGEIFIAEKSGIIKVFQGFNDSTPTVFADLRTQVFNYWDRGMLGMALDPQFPQEPYVYVAYAHDAVIGGTAPLWGQPGVTFDPCPGGDGGCVVSARVSRLRAVAVPGGFQMDGAEQVLVEGWGQQYPSHSIGAIEFGADGALYVTGGEGASYTFVDFGQRGDPPNPLGDPPGLPGEILAAPHAEGGTLRSQSLQRAAGGPVLLNGMVLRIDPQTGAGLSDNPLGTSPDANARRVLAQGLRNPYRFTIKPGTSEVWTGDVGWDNIEEINRVPATRSRVLNFGWPCYEGPARQPAYEAVGLSICQSLYATTGSVDPPVFQYAHAAKVVDGESCPVGSSSISALAFYQGGRYPASFNGALFFGDYARGCLWAALVDQQGQVDFSRIISISGDASLPVDLKAGPDGDLYYVSLGGTLHRLEYLTDAEMLINAVLTATPVSGAAPLAVEFDARQSVGAGLTYQWDFGDGSPVVTGGAVVSHTYATGEYVARLTVTDNASRTATAISAITVTTAQPVPVIAAPTAAMRWTVGDIVTFSGSASDPIDGPLPASALTWALAMHHCVSANSCHAHPIQEFPGVTSGAFPAPDHEYPSYMMLTLTARNARGVQASTSVRLDPRPVTLTFSTEPAGLSLAVGSSSSVATFTRTVIVGGLISRSAPTMQTLNGVTYSFVRWADGSTQSSDLVAPHEDTAFTAIYTTQAANEQSLFGSTLPAVTDGGADSAVELGVRFRADVSGSVTGVRFFKSAANTGPHVGSLWTANGVRLGAVTFTNETTSGWQVARFATPIAITAGTQYVVSYHTTCGHYAIGSNFFSAPHDAGILHAPADNGVFTYGAAGSFPTSIFGASNYWVDVLFVRDPDLTAPTVQSISPAHGSTGASVTQAVDVTFSEALKAETITTSSVIVRDDAGAAVPGALSYNAETFTVRFVPKSVLACGKTHVLTLTGGTSAAALKDLAGNRLAATVTSSFTVAPGGCLSSLVYPVANAAGVVTTRDFEWAPVPGADAYILHIGTAPNTWDVLAAGLLSGTSYRVGVSLPSDRTLYVRVGTRVGGIFRYTASVPFTAAPSLATLIYPAPNQTGVTVARSFEWTTVAGADAYILHVGTAPNTWDVAAAGLITGTSYRLSQSLPTGLTLYARVGARIGGIWHYAPSIPFTAAVSVATMVYPTANQQDVTVSRDFEWTPVPGADAYIMHIGTAPDTWNVVAAGLLTAPKYRVTQALPYDTTLYVRIGSRTAGVWRYSTSIPFKAIRTVASMIYPTANQSGVLLSRAFEWTPVPGADAYILHVGTAANTWDVLAAGLLTTTTYTVTQVLPSDRPLHVRVGARVGGAWRYADSIQFTAAPVTATLIYPTANATGVVRTRDFEWTAVPGADAYILRIGTTPDGWEILAAGLLTQTTYHVNVTLPTNQTLYARVLARVGGVWRYAPSIAFTAAP